MVEQSDGILGPLVIASLRRRERANVEGIDRRR
jgi:hypothetical protein